MIFAVTGLLLQIGLWLFNTKWLTSLANILYIIALRVVFATAQNIMHPPPSPIFKSGLWNIIMFFVVLNILAWVAGYFLTRFFLTLKSSE
jgi:phosphate starvation-inducible membrane PsiE